MERLYIDKVFLGLSFAIRGCGFFGVQLMDVG